MTEHEASRTLVKSPPELWAECSDAASLARHLRGSFGEIRITRLEPETAVAWEGERASGTVRLEPAGWGTRVILTVRPEAGQPQPAPPQPPTAPEPEPPAEPHPLPPAAGPSPAEPPPLPPAAGPAPVVAGPARRGTVEPAPPPRAGVLWRLRNRFGAKPAPASPEPAPPVAIAPEPIPAAPPAATAPRATADGPHGEPAETAILGEPAADAGAQLTAALDSLGQAHHRPFSRA